LIDEQKTMARWKPLMHNENFFCWNWKIIVYSRRNNWWKSTLTWKIVPMNFGYRPKNWKANWRHFIKHRVKFFKPHTWITGWRSLNNFFWTMLCLRYKTKHWLIKTRNGRNGGKLYMKTQKNKSKTIWRLLVHMKKPTWMN
jgi:hypothetical protein